MVKIRDLTNQQLMEKLEKYITLYNRLEDERQKRLDKFGEIDELLTNDEKLAHDQGQADSTQMQTMPKPSNKEHNSKEYTGDDAGSTIDPKSFALDFNEDELQKIQDTCDQEISDAQKLETITKILKLSDLNLGKD